MTTRSLVVVTAGLSEPSSSRLLADRLSEAVTRRLRSAGEHVDVTVVELRPLAHGIADHLLTGFASGPLADALARVAGADGVVAVSPIFNASYSGLFKSFFDVLDADALSGVPVLVGATAGTARHSLSLEHALRPLFSYLRAVVVPTAVFAATEDFGATSSGRLQDRVERAAGELADLVLARPARVPAAPEELAEPTSFEELLRGLS